MRWNRIDATSFPMGCRNISWLFWSRPDSVYVEENEALMKEAEENKRRANRVPSDSGINTDYVLFPSQQADASKNHSVNRWASGTAVNIKNLKRAPASFLFIFSCQSNKAHPLKRLPKRRFKKKKTRARLLPLEWSSIPPICPLDERH